MAFQHPKGGAANDGILRGRSDARVQRQHGLAEFEVLDILLETTVIGRGVDPEDRLAIDEFRAAVTTAPAIFKQSLRAHVGDALDVVHHMIVIEGEGGIETSEAVLLRAHLDIVPGRVILDLGPGLPAETERGRNTARLCLRGSRFKLCPACRDVDAEFVKLRLVVPEHWGRRVERQRQKLVVGRGVIGNHRRKIFRLVERLAGVSHQLVDGIDGTLVFGCHHRRRADLEHLNDMRLFLCAESGDGRRHRLGVIAFVDSLEFIVRLAGVEICRELVDDLTQLPAHGVPELYFGGCIGLTGEGQRKDRCKNKLFHC